MAVFVWVAAAALAGCRSRGLQADSGAETGMLPTGGGGAGGLSVDGGSSDSIIDVDVAPRDTALDFPSRPDTPPFLGSVTENYQCHTLPNTAPVINPLGMSGDRPRRLEGGTITDGHYEMVDAHMYPGDSGITWPTAMRRTITFQNSGTRWLITDFILQSDIAGEDNRPSATVTYTSANTFRATVDSCYPGAAVNDYEYEATPDTITMWFEPRRSLLFYLRAP